MLSILLVSQLNAMGTFNIMNAEGRSVAAAFILPKGGVLTQADEDQIF